MKRNPPTSTVLDTVEPHELTQITEKEAQSIMALLDQWIGECESQYQWILDLSNKGIPKHKRLAEDLRKSITDLKKYSGAIQSDGQSFWALAMLAAVWTGVAMSRLTHDLDWFAKHATVRATIGRQKKAAERRRWLKDQIIEFVRDGRDIEGSLNDRRQLRAAYKSKFVKKDGTFLSDRTFSDDLKALDY